MIYGLNPLFMPCQRRVWPIYRNIIDEYIKNEYSLIPVNGEKKPYIHWKKYQYQRAKQEDIFDWFNSFSEVNIGIVTGNISKLAVIDVDDLNLLPELKELLPEIKETTRVRTRRDIITISLSMANRSKAPIAYSVKDSN